MVKVEDIDWTNYTKLYPGPEALTFFGKQGYDGKKGGDKSVGETGHL